MAGEYQFSLIDVTKQVGTKTILKDVNLSFFYGGLSRRKNVVNTMMMVLAVIGVVGVMWVACGWSFAYGGDGSLPFFGGFDQMGCLSATNNMLAEAANVPEDATYPAIVDIGFQMAFAMITCAIITGAVAGRMKFGAVVAFIALWVPIVYAPLAHMVWGGDGSLIGDVIGALDFAGGDVVHISSGVTGLVLCLLLGKRRGFGVMSYRGVAALALLNTIVASAAGMLSWMLVERIRVGKPTLVGACTGLVAGLVAITPAAGFVEPWAAIVMGFVTAPCCFFAISYAKRRIGYDDALDAFGCHSIGGTVGGLLTGIFCVPFFSLTHTAITFPIIESSSYLPSNNTTSCTESVSHLPYFRVHLNQINTPPSLRHVQVSYLLDFSFRT